MMEVQVVAMLVLACTVNIQAVSNRLQTSLNTAQNMRYKSKISHLNLAAAEKYSLKHPTDSLTYIPGKPASDFMLPTLNGNIKFPSDLFQNQSILFHTWNPASAFLVAMWNDVEAIKPLLLNVSANAHMVLMSVTNAAKDDVSWLRKQVESSAALLVKDKVLSVAEVKSALARVHYVTSPVSKVTPWIPGVLHEWACQDHNCGLSQIVVTSNDFPGPVTLPRLDGRYDWLPSFVLELGNKTVDLQEGGNGCQPVSNVKGRVALVWNRTCDFYEVVTTMSDSEAIGVVIMANASEPVKDMTCQGSECSGQPSIPATMIAYSPGLIGAEQKRITFKTAACDNFNFAIDRRGNLAELGWFLYPSALFWAFQSQWFDYYWELEHKLTTPGSLSITILSNAAMHGAPGAVANITLPPISSLQKAGSLHVDMSLSCPSTNDASCPQWDHTVQLFVTCRGATSLELTRWISPFRRRIGRWLTDVSSLLPLLANQTCSFNVKTVPWASPWVVSLDLKFIPGKPGGEDHDMQPTSVVPLYYPGATFDKHYNSHFKPITFDLPAHAKKVELYSVITGHGSDDHGCGEFCASSHIFYVNSAKYNTTFSQAGTPLGCAEEVWRGVEPNEHGTWLYGRGGWCDGSDVKPWRIDVTHDVTAGQRNTIRYVGQFEGKDPAPYPKATPGVMIVYSYLVFYE